MAELNSNHKVGKNIADKQKAGYIGGIVSLIGNAILFGLKLWAGITTGSVALTGDAWHNASDSIGSLIVIITTKLSTIKPTEKHPYGYGRWDQIASLFIAFLLGLIGYDTIRTSITHFSQGTSVSYGPLAIFVISFSIVAKLVMSLVAFRLSKKANSFSLKANGWDSLTDAFASVALLIGILLSSRFWWMDSVLGIIVALLLFQACFEISKETVNNLLGHEPDPDMVSKIKLACQEKYGYDLEPHHLHLHDYSNRQELVMHIRLDPQLKLGKAHTIASEIEEMIEEQFGMYTTVHMDVLHRN